VAGGAFLLGDDSSDCLASQESNAEPARMHVHVRRPLRPPRVHACILTRVCRGSARTLTSPTRTDRRPAFCNSEGD
jgi:hypothetical protein